MAKYAQLRRGWSLLSCGRSFLAFGCRSFLFAVESTSRGGGMLETRGCQIFCVVCSHLTFALPESKSSVDSAVPHDHSGLSPHRRGLACAWCVHHIRCLSKSAETLSSPLAAHAWCTGRSTASLRTIWAISSSIRHGSLNCQWLIKGIATVSRNDQHGAAPRRLIRRLLKSVVASETPLMMSILSRLSSGGTQRLRRDAFTSIMSPHPR